MTTPSPEGLQEAALREALERIRNLPTKEWSIDTAKSIARHALATLPQQAATDEREGFSELKRAINAVIGDLGSVDMDGYYTGCVHRSDVEYLEQQLTLSTPTAQPPAAETRLRALEELIEKHVPKGKDQWVRDLAREAFDLAALTQPEPTAQQGGEDYEARYVHGGVPTDCVDYGVIRKSAGKEVCRVWERDDAELIARLLNGNAPLNGAAAWLYRHEEFGSELHLSRYGGGSSDDYLGWQEIALGSVVASADPAHLADAIEICAQRVERLKLGLPTKGLKAEALAEAVAAMRALSAQQAAGEAEAVAVIGKDWRLLWASAEPLADIVRRTGIKIGSKLYATPQEGLEP